MTQQRLETVAWSWQVKHCVSGICTTDLWRIIKDINTSSYRPWFLVWPWVAKFVFLSAFLYRALVFKFSFYKTVLWIRWQVLSTFLTSFPLAKRFAPRQKVCVLPPPLAFRTCKNYTCKYRFTPSMNLIRKPDRQSCHEIIKKYVKTILLTLSALQQVIDHFLLKGKTIFFKFVGLYFLYPRIRLLFNDRKMKS